MTALTILTAVLVLSTSFPVSYLIALLCREELVAGRKWLFVLGVAGLIGIPVSIFMIKVYMPVLLTLIYLSILCSILISKSYNNKSLKNLQKFQK